MLALAGLPLRFYHIRSHLREVITSTLYIGPARARSERYYRYQDLAVSEIDPDGKNFAMFLNSLTPYQILELSEWIERLFGYGFKVSRDADGGHMSINQVTAKTTTNIVDTGYGVSQILPVLGQVWWAKERLRQTNGSLQSSLIAIEQPELHLHPAHQALLADAFGGELAQTSHTAPKKDGRVHFFNRDT
jgi:AAA ATPase domain